MISAIRVQGTRTWSRRFRRGHGATNQSLIEQYRIQVLKVEFLNGSIYQYSDVPPSMHKGLMAVASHGFHLARA
ncbi:MAG: KTSC domain-containing protein [Gammaproteobacteria bacterium]|nr:KTSC domain-containing protein [Gammaproteobacteria bacterium]